jgi:hypothetical protein
VVRSEPKGGVHRNGVRLDHWQNGNAPSWKDGDRKVVGVRVSHGPPFVRVYGKEEYMATGVFLAIALLAIVILVMFLIMRRPPPFL